jgi:hypothetical protein
MYAESMQMTVTVSPAAEKILGDLAARNGKSVPEMAEALLEEKLMETSSLAIASGEDDEDPQALKNAIARLTSRTPEEIEAARARLFAQSRPPRPLPEGKTFLDVVCGQWPGDETDEEVYAALAKLS